MLIDHITPAAPEKKFSCCCGWCHVKQGTFILGIVELFLAIIGLAALINRIGDHKRSHLHLQEPSDCSGNGSCAVTLSPFAKSTSHVGDYIGTTLLSLWLLVVIALFYALFNKRPACLIPHLFLQTLTLIFSVVFVILYAWDYFYVELHVRGAPFNAAVFGARVWLISFYVLVAITQVYLFTAILACYRYLSDYRFHLDAEEV